LRGITSPLILANQRGQAALPNWLFGTASVSDNDSWEGGLAPAFTQLRTYVNESCISAYRVDFDFGWVRGASYEWSRDFLDNWSLDAIDIR
jgi:hypothetical protein